MYEPIEGVPQPDPPERMPLDGAPDVVGRWHEYLASLPDDEARIRAVREQLRVARALVAYLTGWRSYFCSRWYNVGATVRQVAKAAGVTDTYVSRRVREVGLEPRGRGGRSARPLDKSS